MSTEFDSRQISVDLISLRDETLGGNYVMKKTARRFPLLMDALFKVANNLSHGYLDI